LIEGYWKKKKDKKDGKKKDKNKDKKQKPLKSVVVSDFIGQRSRSLG